MRPIISIALILFLSAEYVVAQTAAPSTTSPQVVLVLPFSAPAADGYQWVGPSVQQVMAADISHGSSVKVVAPASAQPAADADAALKSAADVGADIVVFGQAQVLDKEVRLTGQVLDVTTGKAITGLKATGPIDELFHLEDAVASQSLSSLPKQMQYDDSQQHGGYADVPSSEPSYQPPAAFDQPYSTGGSYYYPPSSYSYPGYYYPYSYPYSYSYPYGFYGSGFIVVGSSHDHSHDHDHDHDHGDGHDHGGDVHSGGSHGNSWGSGAAGARGGTVHSTPPGSHVVAPRGGTNSGGASRGGTSPGGASHSGMPARGTGGAGSPSRGMSGAGMRGGSVHGGGMGGHR